MIFFLRFIFLGLTKVTTDMYIYWLPLVMRIQKLDFCNLFFLNCFNRVKGRVVGLFVLPSPSPQLDLLQPQPAKGGSKLPLRGDFVIKRHKFISFHSKMCQVKQKLFLSGTSKADIHRKHLALLPVSQTKMSLISSNFSKKISLRYHCSFRRAE